MVGKSAGIFSGIGDETAEDAINGTRRYSISLSGVGYFRSAFIPRESISFRLLCDHVSFFFLFRFVEYVSELEVKQNRVPGKY